MPLSALTVPLGSSPLTDAEEWKDSWRAFPPAPRRDQCVMQVVTKKKIGWKRNPYPCRKTEVRRRWKEPSNDKRKLASSFCPLTSFPPPPVRRPNFQWENYARNLRPGISITARGRFVLRRRRFESDGGVGLKQTY